MYVITYVRISPSIWKDLSLKGFIQAMYVQAFVYSTYVHMYMINVLQTAYIRYAQTRNLCNPWIVLYKVMIGMVPLNY